MNSVAQSSDLNSDPFGTVLASNDVNNFGKESSLCI
jgi:hypothetical protein